MPICCFTGHRDFNKDNYPDVYEKLVQTIKNAYFDGYTHFITGAAKGLDFEASVAVKGLKKEGYSITLEAAVPYPQMIEYYQSAYCIINSDICEYVGEHYSKDIYLKRDRYMVDKSDLVIAVYDGRQKGGTAYTIRYAKKCGKEVILINY